ncbi:DUF4097 family beta strand repeat-containing protein [Microbispora triticiradicis]|uniref:DUF4097 family beta strand repeat-containing protein n=1 Tax=Microbispora triticiradicis TaxID=2200763 RepID=UPI001AD675F1|nr:DUF4097 family beta strand repeat-containing protein [Microbispora triticiradicis]MBO4271313.1 DUF4097 family beta strand repeat protein [Microbispora triticiradicis]
MKNTTLAVAGAALGLSLTVAACGGPLGFGGQQAVQSYDVADAVTLVDTHTGSGDIVVSESDRSGVHVTETLHWWGNKPKTEDGHSVDGGTLELKYKCGRCSVDYKVEVPRGLTVKIDTGSGDLTLRNLTGQVEASTGSGDVDARGLATKEVDAKTGSGDVTLRFTAAPDEVHAVTGSGDGKVWLPDGAYNVDATTGSGERRVDFAENDSAPHTIVVRTGSGDAEVRKL